MSEQNQIQRYVQQFIKENSKTYTREAITQKLADAGYSIADIDDGFEALGLGWDEDNKTKNDELVEPGDWRNAQVDPIGFLIFFPGVPILMFLLGYIDPNLFGWVYLIALIAGFFVPMYVKHNNPNLAKGLIYGFRTYLVLFVCLPLVAGLVLFGICLVSIGQNL